MGMQLLLLQTLEQIPRARRSDPESSHAAAKRVDSVCERRRNALLELVRRYPRHTTKWCAQIAYMERHEAGRRMSELVRDGLVAYVSDGAGNRDGMLCEATTGGNHID